MYVHVRTHMWVSGDNLWCLHFETGYLTGLGFQVGDEQGAPLVTSPPPSPCHFDYKCEPPHLGFLWVLVIKLRSLHLWGKHVTNTVISSAPFSFSSPDSSCGRWLLPWWPLFKPSRWRFPVLLWKFPNEGQNKPFCFRSSHIRHVADGGFLKWTEQLSDTTDGISASLLFVLSEHCSVRCLVF